MAMIVERSEELILCQQASRVSHMQMREPGMKIRDLELLSSTVLFTQFSRRTIDRVKVASK
jgi:hypothetical protein